MRFIDEAIITVESGDGGRGCVSFRREKFIERGGPDGGDGGDGGDVVLKTTNRKRTLYQFRFTKKFKAKNGNHGHGQQKHGKNGKDIIVEIPPGTIVTNEITGELIKDFVKPDEIFTIARGGQGGRGNKRFATSTYRAPKFAQPGEPGESFSLKLELKLLADAGIIGFPNAGKSTLISVLSSARPKIGNYPFTTLTPNIGIVTSRWNEPYAIADIPGLVEGAHKGTGLGIKFLKHIERTRILVHLVDVSSIIPENPLYHFHTINKELALYSEKLAEKPRIVVLSKIDITETRDLADVFIKALGKEDVLLISAVTGEGVENLKSRIGQLIDKSHG